MNRTLPLRVFESSEALSQHTAQEIIASVRRRPDLLLCVATGATPTRTYGLLAEAAALTPALFSRLRVLKLDEWGGLDPADAGTSETYVRRHVLAPLRIDDSRYFGFNSNPADPAQECARYSDWLAVNGPVDMAILGLGVNGHVALNEPASALPVHAHVAQLAPTSLQHSMLTGRRPAYGLTPGIGDLLAVRRVLFLVSGATKREPLKRLLEPTISTQFPASFLWLHSNAQVLCDAEAMGDHQP